jgi:hypothetical protein
MACHTKGTCSYSDESKVRVIEQVRSDGPRRCAANERLYIVCDYASPGVWSAELFPGETVTVKTNGQPGDVGNWRIEKAGLAQAIGTDCPDLPIKIEGGMVTDTCTAYKFQQLLTYLDGSTVFRLQQVDLLNNGTC